MVVQKFRHNFLCVDMRTSFFESFFPVVDLMLETDDSTSRISAIITKPLVVGLRIIMIAMCFCILEK